MQYDQTPPVYRDNLERLAWHLERIRAAARRSTDPAPGVRLAVYSAWRGPLENREVGGVPSSQHLTGEAADFKVIGTDVGTFLERLEASGVNLETSELIVYPLRGGSGVHAGLPMASGPRNTVLVQIAGGRYLPVALADSAATYREWRKRFGQTTAAALVGIVVLGVVVWLAMR